MKVFNLSVERGYTYGVAFSPVLRDGCWVGEADVTDPVALARFAKNPGSYIVVGEVTDLSAADPVGSGVDLSVETKAGGSPVEDEPRVPAPVAADVTNVGAGVGQLPNDFPGYKYLLEAEFATYEDVKSLNDQQLEALKGIGSETVKAIRKALAPVPAPEPVLITG